MVALIESQTINKKGSDGGKASSFFSRRAKGIQLRHKYVCDA